MSQIRTAGSGVILAGIVALVLGALAGTAGADDEGDFQNDPSFSVSATRTYDADADETTFTFTLSSETGERASHVVLASCPEGQTPVSTTGPDGATPADEDGTQPPTGHVGVKYEPGNLGTYTVTFAGDLAGAQFIVRNGPGHRHFFYGPPCEDGTQATTTTTAPPTTTTVPPTTTTTDGAVGGIVEETTTTTTAPPGGAEAGGEEAAGAEVMGETEERSGQLPRTGPTAAAALALVGTALVFGGFSLRCAAGRRR